MMKILLAAASAFLTLAFADACAQEDNPIRWSLRPAIPSPTRKPGETFDVNLKATIADGWHLYALSQPPGSPVLATRVSIPNGRMFKLGGAAKSPDPQVALDPNFGIETEFYEMSATFVIPVIVLPKASPGKQTLLVNIFYQTCNDRSCLPPKTDTARLSIHVREDDQKKTGAAEPR